MRRPAATTLMVLAHVVVLILGLAGAARDISSATITSSSSKDVAPTSNRHRDAPPPAARDSTHSAESADVAAVSTTSISDDPPDFQAAKAAFLQQYGQDYGYGGWLDANWHHEVQSRFGPHMQHYLDFTGSALFTRSHIRAASELLEQHTFSNPHSRNPSSLAAEQQVQEARQRVLQFFNADEAEYTVIWTSGATAALKLVGEAFPWTSPQGWQPPRHRTPGGYSDTDVGAVAECGAVGAGALSDSPETSQFVYLRSNHKSVLGIGAYAKARGCQLSCVTEADMEEWLNLNPSTGPAQAHVVHAQAAGASAAPVGQQQQQGDAAAAAARTTFSLVAYPSKDNYEGRLHSLDWIDKVHAKSTDSHKWLVVLDAAAHVPTHKLDLSHYKPDFVPVSFYKLFGFPSGLGALIARKESVELLHKIYFGGGSVVDSTAEDVWRVLMPPPDGYEDGTQNFLSIAQLHFGFKQLEQLGGIQAVERHVRTLQAWMYEALSTLSHSNGAPLVKLFGHHHLRDPTTQSCIFQLLVLRPDGSVVSSASVEKLAAAQGIGIREGCMCNPSACLVDLGITPQEQQARILNNTDVSSGFLTVWRPAPDGSGKLVPVQLPTGSVRASLGYLSTFEDVWAYVQFLRRNYKDGGTQSNANAASTAAEAAAAGAAAGSQRVMVE